MLISTLVRRLGQAPETRVGLEEGRQDNFLSGTGRDVVDAELCLWRAEVERRIFAIESLGESCQNCFTGNQNTRAHTHTQTHTRSHALSVCRSVCLSVSLSLSLSHTHTQPAMKTKTIPSRKKLCWKFRMKKDRSTFFLWQGLICSWDHLSCAHKRGHDASSRRNLHQARGEGYLVQLYAAFSGFVIPWGPPGNPMTFIMEGLRDPLEAGSHSVEHSSSVAFALWFISISEWN